MTVRQLIRAALCCASLSAASCGRADTADTGDEAAASAASPVRESPGPEVGSAVAVSDSSAPSDSAVLQPGALRTVSAAAVTGWTGPGGEPFEVLLRTRDPGAATDRRFGVITRGTSLRVRTPDLGQFPCTSCHLGRGTAMADARIEDAHRNVQPRHPEQTGAACATCHAPDNVELLALKSGERATLDHTYRLCAQCHFRQAEDWAAGAHGKRLDGWQGRRVVMGCADCHDPHDPRLEPRTPFRAPVLKRTRSDKP